MFLGVMVLECGEGYQNPQIRLKMLRMPCSQHRTGPPPFQGCKSKPANPGGARLKTSSVARAPLGRLPPTGLAFRER